MIYLFVTLNDIENGLEHEACKLLTDLEFEIKYIPNSIADYFCTPYLRDDKEGLYMGTDGIRQFVKQTAKISDTEMLDWLDKTAVHHKGGWVCRLSSSGRGLRLLQATRYITQPTVREAITHAMKHGLTKY